ncbi:MAG: 4Fe-4S binding protein [Hahellaceae bacterium]|nr:4Fe-4S binding protein [Hahellaceae bacterium]MCP5169728.1 4Fe-4S binding protein [Hahellaceae bacterium]
MISLQQKRFITRSLFFAAFLLAPVLDLFRFDLTTTQFVIFGERLSFELTTQWLAQTDALDAGLRILTRFLLPLVSLIAIGLFVFWRWGRIYCGWLCPHFSVVETINRMMRQRLGRVSLWEPQVDQSAEGGLLNWVVIVSTSVAIAFVWALGLLSYLLPPLPLYSDLIHLQLSGGEIIFLAVATTVFTLDFIFARHLFCKYGCAFGVFQSLFWMMNPKALVVAFDTDRAKACQSCDKDCEEACPMRLSVRGYKRAKFTCTQCGECVSACQNVQKNNPDGTLIDWRAGEKTKQTSLIPMVNKD